MRTQLKLSWKELNTIKLRSDLVDVELLKVIAPVHMLPVDTTASIWQLPYVKQIQKMKNHM